MDTAPDIVSFLSSEVGGSIPSPTPPATQASKPTIKSCNFSHDAIAQWLIANPGGQLGECADHFGYTRSWLSIIIHSDAFQARYKELLAGADAAVINDIPAKIRGTVSRALDGLAEAVDIAAASEQTLMHRGFLLETSDKLLRDLGYGPQKPSVQINTPALNQQNNFIAVAPDDLARARDKLLKATTLSVLPAPSTT